MVLGLTGSLMVGNCMSAFASESGAYLYGQELAKINNKDQKYFAIVVGDVDGVIDRNELTFDKGNYSYQLWGLSIGIDGYQNENSDSPENYGKSIPELKKTNGVWDKPEDLLNEGNGFNKEDALEFLIAKSSGMNSLLGIVKLPDNVSVSELSSNLRKYVIYAQEIPQNKKGWKSDAVGWWYSNGDGTYPVNEWKEIDGKRYFFGEDGYMLHDTTTPDGRKVGSDGVLIAEYQYNAEQLSAIEKYKQSVVQNTRVKVETEFYFDDELKKLGEWVQNSDSTWSFRKKDGSFVINAWIQSSTGERAYYYVDSTGKMLINGCTPYGYVTDSTGLWTGTVAKAEIDYAGNANEYYSDMAEISIQDPEGRRVMRDNTAKWVGSDMGNWTSNAQ
jgi:hypothetical protein